jgi:hypothetical protein
MSSAASSFWPGGGGGRPRVAPAECSGACNERDARVEILAVQRSAVRSAVPERARRVPCHLLSAHTEGCSPRCFSCAECADVTLSAPMWHGVAQQPDGASAASAGAVGHGSCLASHCHFVVNRIEGRWTPEGRKQQVPAVAKRKSECGREAPRTTRAFTYFIGHMPSPCSDPVANTIPPRRSLFLHFFSSRGFARQLEAK